MSTEASLLPPNATPLEDALARVGLRFDDVETPIAALWNPQTCPIGALPWLAWTLSIDKWDTDWTEARKRAETAGAIEQQRRKGSVTAARDALAAIDSLLTLVEQPPRIAPHAYQVRLPVVGADGVVGGARCSAATTAQIVADVTRAAPVRSQLELVLDLVVDSAASLLGAAQATLYRRMVVGGIDTSGLPWSDLITDEIGEPLADDVGTFIDGSAA